MRTFLLLLLTFAMSPALSLAQVVQHVEIDGGVTIYGRGLSRVVKPQYQPERQRQTFTLQVNQSIPEADTNSPFHELMVSFALSDTTGMMCSVQNVVWKEVGTLAFGNAQTAFSASVRYLGQKAWKPYAVVEIHPFKTEGKRVFVADSFTVNVSWSSYRQSETLPPAMQPVVVQSPWYQPSQPHVRITTNADAVTRILGSKVLSVEPKFQNVPTNQLALFYRGIEQAIGIVDKNADGRFNTDDEVIFAGKHPMGETAWLDVYDTTAVFFLTTSELGDRRRLTFVNEQSVPTDSILDITIHQRIERDSGFYHLGTARNILYSEFNSDEAPFEGYYWSQLKADSKKNERFGFRLQIKPESMMKVSADYVASSYADNYKPNSKVVLSVNGNGGGERETDTVARYVVEQSVSTSNSGCGIHSVKFFAPGIEQHIGKPDYLSDVLLDAFEVDAQALIVLESGRIQGTVQSTSGPSRLDVMNTEVGGGYVLDTTNAKIYSLSKTQGGVTIQAGLSRPDRFAPNQPLETSYMRASVVINNSEHSIDSLNGFFLAWKVPGVGKVNFQSHSTSASVEQAILALASNTAICVGNAGAVTSPSLKNTLQQRGVNVPDAKYWVVGGLGDGTTRTASSNVFGPVGVFVTSPRSTATTILQAGNSFQAYISDAEGIQEARVAPAQLANLGSANPQADVIYVTHKTHLKQTERLAQHRSTFDGVSTRIVDVDEVIAEFGAGHRSPYAVKAFLKQYYVQAPEPKPSTLVLVGNATWDPRIAIPKGNANSQRPDQVPTYGRPSSDFWFGLLDDSLDYALPELVVGRIPAITEIESKAVVDKIIFSDTSTFQPWMRKFLFVGGGSEQEGLCQIYKDLLQDPFNTGITYTNAPLCLDTATVCRPEAPPNAGYILKQNINAGVQWMNYIGHGATDVFDIPGWDANELDNSEKYGVLATYACQTGAYSNPSTLCKNAQYLVEPGRGFAAAVGGTGWAYIQTVNFLHYRIHESMRNSGLRSIGEIVYESKVGFATRGDQDGINTAMQYCILGDPLMKIKLDTKVDVLLRASNISVKSVQGTSQLVESDSFAVVNVNLLNRGLGSETPFSLAVKRTFKGTTDTVLKMVPGICKGELVSFQLPISGMVGEHQLVVIADAEGVLNDDVRNNIASITIGVFAKGAQPLEPMPYGTISSRDPHVRVIDGLWDRASNPSTVQFNISTTTDPSSVILTSSSNDVVRDGSIVTWNPSFVMGLPKGPAWLSFNVFSPASNDTSATIWVPINIGIENSAHAVILANRMLPDPAGNSEFDATNESQRLLQVKRDIFIRASGIGPSAPSDDSTLRFRIGDVEYVNNQFFRGMNLVLLKATDTVPRMIRRYDTYLFPDNTEGWHNGSSKDLITFLRDSVESDDIVYLFTWLESLTGFERDTTLAVFQELMHEYGSVYVDSLREASSWIYIGRRGLVKGTATELWKDQPDRQVSISTPQTFYRRNGTVSTDWIGPARKWEMVQFEDSKTSMEKLVFGKTDAGQIVLVDSLAAGKSEWLASSSSDLYRYIRVAWRMHIDSVSESLPSVTSAVFNYQPADEWVVEKQSVSVSPNTVLRGDTTTVNFEVKNARSLQSTLPSDVSVIVTSGVPGQDAYKFTLPLRQLNGDEVVPISTTAPSILAANNASVIITANTSVQPEMYGHNNQDQASLRVDEDTTAPSIEVRADGVVVTAGGFVQRKPKIDVIVRDNSKLPVNDSGRLIVFVNGDRIKTSTSDDYQFFGTQAAQIKYNDNAIRSAMTFRYSMDDGQNNLVVRASDATQNAASIEPQLFVSSNIGFGVVRSSPNPTTGPTTFTVELKGITENATWKVTIVDAQGRHIHTVHFGAHVGLNTIEWDGLNSAGSTVSQGLYMYRVTSIAETGEPLSSFSGTLLLLR